MADGLRLRRGRWQSGRFSGPIPVLLPCCREESPRKSLLAILTPLPWAPSLLGDFRELDATRAMAEAAKAAIARMIVVTKMDPFGKHQFCRQLHSIHCDVPQRAVGHYSRRLSSITAGQGSYSLTFSHYEFSHYETVPGDVQRTLMDAAEKGSEEEVTP